MRDNRPEVPASMGRRQKRNWLLLVVAADVAEEEVAVIQPIRGRVKAEQVGVPVKSAANIWPNEPTIFDPIRVPIPVFS